MNLAPPSKPLPTPLRIVHVITRFIQGGADENTLLCCNGHAARGHDVHLVYGAEASPSMVGRVDPAVHCHQLSDLRRAVSPVHDARATMRLARLLTGLQPQIVHTHTSKAGAIGRVAARMAGVQGVVHGIHILPFMNVGQVEHHAYVATERVLGRITDAFVDVSEAMREAATTHGVGAMPQHVVVPSGMELERFRGATPVSDGARVAAGIAPGAKLAVMVAALEPRKRVIEFLRVFKRIAGRETSTVLAVLGEGPCRGDIERAVQELGLCGRVVLLGFRPDVERWIAAADVCLLASEREGLPRAVIQYVLAGRPTVVTALPGVTSLVTNGMSGFVVPLDGIDAMEDAVCAILSDPVRAAAMSAAARRVDLSRWSTEHMIARLEQVYLSVIGIDQTPFLPGVDAGRKYGSMVAGA